jgi:hypothetical protein
MMPTAATADACTCRPEKAPHGDDSLYCSTVCVHVDQTEVISN